MNKKRLNEISLFVAAAVFIVVAIMYFAGAGAARLVANSIENGVNTLVENSESDASGIALVLSALGVGATVAIAFVLRVLGVIHIFGGVITGIQAFVVKKGNDSLKIGLSRGFTIWALVRFILYALIHIVVMCFVGINIRSVILAFVLIVATIVSIYAMVSDGTYAKKIAKKAEGLEPTIHM